MLYKTYLTCDANGKYEPSLSSGSERYTLYIGVDTVVGGWLLTEADGDDPECIEIITGDEV